ncbi:MAG: TatD family hydrolase [Cellvibrionaceae bacterium]
MIDSHCHFDFDAFDGQRDKVLLQCAELGVDGLVVPGVEPSQWDRSAELIAKQKSACQLYAAFGMHPWWLSSLTLTQHQFTSKLDTILTQKNAIAIGECGLDGSIETDVERQQAVFEWQLQLACDRKLPLIIHAHRAHNDVIRLLSRYRPQAGGVIHGFSGSEVLAQQYWRLGFYLGVGGTITYPRANKTRMAITQLPLEALVLETDAPDMPLHGAQGQPNSPIRLPQIAGELARLRELPVEVVMSQTASNTRKLFSLDVDPTKVTDPTF